MTRLLNKLVPGVYVPTLTFFNAKDESLDLESTSLHVTRLVKAGVAGIVALGSNGEVCNLNDEERTRTIATIRDTLNLVGHESMPIIAGVSQQSVVNCVSSCIDAYNAGADAGLIIAPSYYRHAITNDLLVEFFTQVADKSPVPLVLYNFPGVVAGIDLDSDLIIRLSRHPNIIGVKFTCGNTGKLSRVVGATKAWSPLNHPKGSSISDGDFVAFAGMADFVVPALALGGFGVISGAANLIPKTIVSVYNSYVDGDAEAAWEAQSKLSEADWALTKIGIWGSKEALQHYQGYGSYMRSPAKRLTPSEANIMLESISPFLDAEKVFDS
ncbi:hypothetical protein AWJ20_3293 [Sugiyamaella lignohabitans]|uniref:Dihydrodipicolinate synthase n=1 Tax=Sugiyamaella lignohabitans TaxID=796027 RepID=A0A167FSQ8_9ASCO|nr:uncharacterized protein AWJ20_3293 [Sugiyamaella lignohabitans]ANB15655.1 hypothetical protein AWJ20_3293 [Sugiyamaella lignohabitans]